MRNKPRFKHDCNRCIYLGQYNDADLYFCMQGGSLPTVIARYSSDGPDYISGIFDYLNTPDLSEAKARAVDAGLLPGVRRNTGLGTQPVLGRLVGAMLAVKRFIYAHIY